MVYEPVSARGVQSIGELPPCNAGTLPSIDPSSALITYHSGRSVPAFQSSIRMWITTVGGHHASFAAGYGGQYIGIIPALDVVAVTTAPYDLPPEQTQEHRCLLTDFIVPAVIE